MDSNEVRQEWAQRSGKYSPDYYADYGPSRTSELLGWILDYFLDRDAAVLEVGCSSGRHLAHLREQGYENLHGVEINEEALDVMAETYPDLAADGTFHAEAVEDVVEEFDDDRFDAVYTVETLELVPPESEWVFEELARVADDLLITVENEGEDDRRTEEIPVDYVDGEFPLYYRAWDDIFGELGFTDIYSKPAEMDTLRVFRPAEYYS
ncbi:class I SAM-dependent methyltransferase [Halorussus sp. AFM4]|uniref:class I SAM-dependent methyltransferase n=1 Tax=Halorussus sp. AFM4 TaxID=3421651 RepID=UPI003EBA24EB